jgi:PAS domain S-box-containing protein
VNEAPEKNTDEVPPTEGSRQGRAEICKAVVDTVADAIVINVGTKRVFINNAFLELHGLDDESQVLGTRLDQFIVPEDRQLVSERTLARQQDQAVPGVYEYRFRRSDGEVRTVETSAAPITYEGHPADLAVLRDVTERKKAEQQIREYREKLQALTIEVSLAEERERRRIAMGLHDDVGQVLAIAKVKLSELLQAEPSGESSGLIKEIRTLIDDTIKTIRLFTFELSSPVLYTLGLDAALEQLTGQLQKQTRVRCHFTSDKQPRPLSDQISIVLYRIVRELIRNIEKHAQARQVKVEIARVGDQVRITVEDDGVGFDASDIGRGVTATGHFGFFSIQEQLQQLGGRLELESVPGEGTRAVVVAPLQ